MILDKINNSVDLMQKDLNKTLSYADKALILVSILTTILIIKNLKK